MMPIDDAISRRTLLKSGAGALAAATLPAQSAPQTTGKGEVRFGLLADIHHNRMPGAQDRLHSFLEEASRRPLDFLIQLGDFCDGYRAQLTAEQKQFVADWHRSRIPHYSVLGNHEMDHGNKSHMVELLRMPKNYYSFDVHKFHFVVLDCMHVSENGKIVDYLEGNYFKHTADEINLIDPQQLEWLVGDLKATRYPTVVFTHPCINSFWAAGAETTRANVRTALSQANKEAGWQKVIACLSGHHHVDHLSQWENVNYLLVNSASYYWVGEKYGKLAKYRDALFTFITLDPRGVITVEGKNSVFVPPTPAEMHFPQASYLTASIEGRKISFTPRDPGRSGQL